MTILTYYLLEISLKAKFSNNATTTSTQLQHTDTTSTSFTSHVHLQSINHMFEPSAWDCSSKPSRIQQP